MSSFVRDFGRFLASHKRWWLAPWLLFIVAVLFMAYSGGEEASPFLYSMF